jgi:hypothetical protein
MKSFLPHYRVCHYNQVNTESQKGMMILFITFEAETFSYCHLQDHVNTDPQQEMIMIFFNH